MPKTETNGEITAQESAKRPWHAIPWDVAGRIGLLLLTLCALKLTMLVGFRKHLFETHWRAGTQAYNWVNEVAFYLFAILVGSNLWRFAQRCSVGGVQTVRAANTIVLLTGICFLSLTFHAGDKNYLYPVMNGTLTWWDLRWYLSQDFFFQPPFLAAWVFVYALLYYALARTKRGHLILYFTTIFAVVYVAFFLRDLVIYRNELVVVDCLGIACLLAGRKSTGSLNWFWAIQPWVWFAFIFFLFWLQGDLLLKNNPETVVLWGWSFVLFAGLSVFAWQRKFAPAWLWLLPFAFTSFLLLVNINYPGATNYQNLFFVGLTLPRYFLGQFLIAMTLLVAATIYRRLLPSASLLWLDGINLLLITIALVDLRISQIMGIRLDWQVIEFGASTKMIWREAKPYLPELAFGLIVLISLYAILVGLWQRETLPAKSLQTSRGAQFFLISFLLLGFVGNRFAASDKAEGASAILLLKTSPLFAKAINPAMDKSTFIKTADQLDMQQMLKSSVPAPTHARRDLNVVLIFQESSYNKYLSLFDGTENTEPLLSQYKDRMELFPNFFSDYAASMNARFAAFSGLYPTRDVKNFTYHHVNVDSLFDILHQNSYACSVFYSSFIDYTGFRDFLQGRGLDAMFDADTMPGVNEKPPLSWGLRESQTLNAIKAQIKQYSTNHQKFFLTYVPAAPHNPFDGTPHEFKKYDIKIPGDFTPLYLNELLYMDWVMTSIIDELKDAGLLDNTLIVITADHGEMLGENGGPIGHGWAVTPQLVNIPLIIMNPDKPGYHVNDTVGSEIDLLPTILDSLGMSVPQGQLYQGVSLYSPDAQADRTIYLNSFQQYGIIKDHRLICGNRETEGRNSDAASSVKTFAIANDGARTIFLETNSLNAPLPSISQFDNFQENFLQNYLQYRQILQTTNP